MKQKMTDMTVILTDFNPLVLENLQRNVNLNDLSDICVVRGLDFYQQSGKSKQNWIAMDIDCSNCDQVDIILAADIICQPSDAIAVANTLHDALKPSGVAYIVCADAAHRFGVDHLCTECQRVGLTISTKSITHGSDAEEPTECTIRLLEEDVRNLELTTGYVCGMKLTLFVIRKQQ
jgi:Lysine methyltransferase